MKRIRIKIIARGQSAWLWQKQLPTTGPVRDKCKFIWEMDAPDYDWLVVVDDVSRHLMAPPERLACADEHTLLVTTEPPTITQYGTAFCAQFNQVLTSQPPDVLKHPNRMFSHTGNLWFNGHSFDELNRTPFPEKTAQLSTVCSSKQQRHTAHNERYRFSHWLKAQLPSLEIYGHGSRYIEHKYQALDPFRFHLAIENYFGLHHWTEKLADPFLSGTFPFYCGCTNLSDYFPEESYVAIDIRRREEALDTIRNSIGDDSFYPSRVEALREARHRVLHEYNLLQMVGKIAMKNFDAARPASNRPLYGRKQMRVRHPADALSQLSWHVRRHFT